LAEMPGEFRPTPDADPTEKVKATGAKAQPLESFPKSRATSIVAPKAKMRPQNQPTLRANELVFNAGWKMVEAPRLKLTNGAILSVPGIDVHAWYNATVPGTALTTLVNEGVYPDPYFGLNNLSIPENLNKQDYWFRTEFNVPKTFVNRELWLSFEGINYYAEIWLNGEYLGHITGAFKRGRFNVTRFVKPEATNTLAVMIVPPPNPGTPSEQSVKFGPGDNGGRLCLDGPTFVCAEGWDWIPAIRDRDTGIWQDVILRATGFVTISDPQVVTVLPLPDTSQADITIQADLHNVADTVRQGVLRGAFEGVQFEQPVVLQAGETKSVSFAPKDFPQLTVMHPRLWWPNGYGKAELYHLQLTFVTKNKSESDAINLRFGIREMSYEMAVKMPDGQIQRVDFTPTLAPGSNGPVIDNRRESMDWHSRGPEKLKEVSVWPGAEHSPALKYVTDESMGPYLIIKVNGKRIFCNGGNWGMDDAMKRISRERLEPYIRLTRDANLTMIRNWVGQSTSETFYELCDEYGIFVWNDFWMSTEGSNYAPSDRELFLHNVADTVKRFRNHPSIAIWCARNEGVPPEDINQGIDRLIREIDGTRYYQPNSRLVNLCASGPWSTQPLEKYFGKFNHGFSTEMGAASIPSAEVMRTMMSPEDLWPPGDVWAYHDLHSRGALSRDAFLGEISQRYGEFTNLDDFCRKAEMLNYETYRAIYEGFESRLWNDCSGVLLWMSHPSWPSVVWQLYSWDYEPNASYFGAKKAGEPVHIQMNLPDCNVAVINHRFTPLENITADSIIYDMSGQELRAYRTNFTAAANACSDIFTLGWPQDRTYFVKLELHDNHGHLLSDNFYWHSRIPGQLRELSMLQKVKLTGQFHAVAGVDKTDFECTLTNPSNTPALAIKLTLRDAATGKRVLPAYYDDNYFSLLPGDSREVHIETDSAMARVQLDLDGWNIEHSILR